MKNPTATNITENYAKLLRIEPGGIKLRKIIPQTAVINNKFSFN